MGENLKINKGTMIAALITGTLICTIVYILGELNIHMSWPAFMPFVFFTIAGWKKDQFKNIFAGGVAGILMSRLVMESIYQIVGETGVFTTYLIPIFIAVFILIGFGDILPMFFNNYTFGFYTIAIAHPVQDTFEWIGILLIGGAIFAGGMLFLMDKFIKQPEAPPEEVIKEAIEEV